MRTAVDDVVVVVSRIGSRKHFNLWSGAVRCDVTLVVSVLAVLAVLTGGGGRMAGGHERIEYARNHIPLLYLYTSMYATYIITRWALTSCEGWRGGVGSAQAGLIIRLLPDVAHTRSIPIRYSWHERITRTSKHTRARTPHTWWMMIVSA